MENEFDYDLAVIGAGSAGISAALHGVSLGARTAIIEKAKVGGEMLWAGCVPSKTLIQSARVMATVARSEEFGVHVENTRLVWGAVRMRIAAVRDEIRENQQIKMKAAGLKIISGAARFVDEHSLAVTAAQGERIISAHRIILAAGAKTKIPAVPGLSGTGYLTSETLFDIPTLPHSLAIIGGGPAACELAQALARFGRSITLLEQGPGLLPEADSELSEAALKILLQEGVRVHCNVRFLGAGREEKSWLKFLDGGGREQTVEAGQIVLAAGKEARLSSLCLENAGVRWDERGVFVDEYLRTGAKSIFACGDVTGKFLLTHLAEYQARLAARNALSSARTKADYSVVPSTTFLDPEISSLGLTEAEATRQGEHQVYRAEFKDLDRAIIDGETEGFLKVITSPNGRILGAHIVGARAGELIHNYVPAVRDGALMQELAETLHVYPTFSEIGFRAAQSAIS